MKQIFLFLILGYSNIAFCQTSLKVTPCFCDSDNQVLSFDHKVELYKEGKLVTNEFYPINDFTVKELKKGKYQLKYKSIFEQEYQIEISLHKQNERLKICIDDYMPIGNINFIKNLAYQDTLELKVYATGCAYQDYGKIQITKKGNRFEGTLIKSNEERFDSQLNKRDIALIKKLEDKVRLIQEHETVGYTITFHYEVRINGVLKISTMFYTEAIDYAKTLKKLFNLGR